jgi:hypothetical protein
MKPPSASPMLGATMTSALRAADVGTVVEPHSNLWARVGTRLGPHSNSWAGGVTEVGTHSNPWAGGGTVVGRYSNLWVRWAPLLCASRYRMAMAAIGPLSSAAQAGRNAGGGAA